MEALWVFLAFVCGLIAQYLRLPILLGYLVAGFILAEWEVTHTEYLTNFADLGLSILLFTVGLHLRAKSFFRPEVLGTALIHLAILTTLYSYFLWYFTGGFFVELACAFGFSSTVVTVSALEKRRELASFVGRLALGILVIQDIVSVVLIAGDAGYELNTRAFLLLGLVPIAYLVRLLLLKLESRELYLLLGVAYAFVCDDLFSQLGLSGHIGALLAGATLAGHDQSERVANELWSIKELLLLALFLSIGLYGLPPLEFVPKILGLLLLLPLKGLLFFALFLLFRLRARTAFVTALALTAYSEFTIVVAFYLQRSGSIPAEFVSSTAVVTAISFSLCSLLFSRANSLWNSFEPVLSYLQPFKQTVDRSPVSFGKADLLVIGMGVGGMAAYDRSIEMGCRPLGLDNDPARVEERLNSDKRVVQVDCQDASFWAEAQLSNIRSIILTIPSFRTKVTAIELIRKRGFKGRVLALARDSSSARKLEDLGVEVSVIPMVEAGVELAERIEQD